MQKCHLKPLAVVIIVVSAALSGGLQGEESLIENPEVVAAINVFDAWAEHTVSNREQPGVSIAMVYDRDLIWVKGYGYADLEKKIPATPQTAYRIASLTKLFTATAILQLRDAGKLQLDDPVAEYLPWFRLKDTCQNSPVITIWHMLTHTSGLPREFETLYWDEMNFPEAGKFIKMFQEATTILPREKEIKYSNVAFAVLGHVIEAVSGEKYTDYIKSRILEPLGMTGTEVNPRKDMLTLATGYKRRVPGQPREVEPFIDLKGMTSLGNMASTVEDLAKFIALQFRDRQAGGSQILKGSTLREMQRVHWLNPDWKSGRGLGWAVARIDDWVRIQHSGYVDGYISYIAAAPKEKFGVVVLTNSGDGRAGTFVKQVWKTVAPAVRRATEAVEKRPVFDSSWIKYLGKYEWQDKFVMIVMNINSELALVDPEEDDPWESMIRLEPVSEGLFRMKDQWQKGETVRFETNKDGVVDRIVLPGYSLTRN